MGEISKHAKWLQYFGEPRSEVHARVEPVRLEQVFRKGMPIRSVVIHPNAGTHGPHRARSGQGEGRAAGGLVLAKCSAAHNGRII